MAHGSWSIQRSSACNCSANFVGFSRWRRSRFSSFQRNAGSSAIAGSNPTTSQRSEEHTSELQSLMRISYAVFCLKKKKKLRKQKRYHKNANIHTKASTQRQTTTHNNSNRH